MKDITAKGWEALGRLQQKFHTTEFEQLLGVKVKWQLHPETAREVKANADAGAIYPLVSDSDGGPKFLGYSIEESGGVQKGMLRLALVSEEISIA